MEELLAACTLSSPAEQLRQLPQVEAALGEQARALLMQLDATCRAIEQLTQAAEHAFSQHPHAAILTSFPGLGQVTTARVLAEAGDDRTRFTNARSLRAYARSATGHPRLRHEPGDQATQREKLTGLRPSPTSRVVVRCG